MNFKTIYLIVVNTLRIVVDTLEEKSQDHLNQSN